MALSYKVLGQTAAAAGTDGTVYSVPALAQAVVSSLVFCNRGAATTIRARVAVNGAASANAQFLFYDAALAAGQTLIATIGLTLGAQDQIICQSASGLVSVSAFGQEIT